MRPSYQTQLVKQKKNFIKITLKTKTKKRRKGNSKYKYGKGILSAKIDCSLNGLIKLDNHLEKVKLDLWLNFISNEIRMRV
jgi:hypothetical protein